MKDQPQFPMKIGAFSALCKTPASTLRHYDQCGVLKPDRLENGYRVYTQAHLERLRKIQQIQRNYDYSLDQIKEMLDNPDAPRPDLLKQIEQHHASAVEYYIKMINLLSESEKEEGGPFSLQEIRKFLTFPGLDRLSDQPLSDVRLHPNAKQLYDAIYIMTRLIHLHERNRTRDHPSVQRAVAESIVLLNAFMQTLTEESNLSDEPTDCGIQPQLLKQLTAYVRQLERPEDFPQEEWDIILWITDAMDVLLEGADGFLTEYLQTHSGPNGLPMCDASPVVRVTLYEGEAFAEYVKIIADS